MKAAMQERSRGSFGSLLGEWRSNISRSVLVIGAALIALLAIWPLITLIIEMVGTINQEGSGLSSDGPLMVKGTIMLELAKQEAEQNGDA